jgi:hypothetical protein
MPCGSATTPRSIAAAEKGQAVWPGSQLAGTWRGGLRRSAGERGGGGKPSGATSVRRGQGGAKRRSRQSRGKTDTGGAEFTPSRWKRPCHVQMYVSSVGFQARRSGTGGSQQPVSGVHLFDRWTARRGAPPCDLGSCGNTSILQGVGEMEAGSEQCKEPDDEKPLLVVCRLIGFCRFDGKVSQFCRGESNGSRRTECNWGA